MPEPGTELWFPRGYTVLSSEAYDRLLSDVFGVTPAEPGTTPFWSFERLTLSAVPPAAADRAMTEAAEQFVARLSDDQLLGPLGCDGGQVVDEACAALVSTRFARRLWRRDLEPSESEALLALFTEAAPGAEMEALRQLVRAILSNRDAYMLPTLGTQDADGRYRLTDLELAGLLAVGLTGMPPDDELLETALADKLDLQSAAEDALESEGARGRMDELIRRWFGIRNREQLWLHADQPELTLSMYEETRRFIESVLFTDPQPLSALVTADFSIIDSNLALLYGLDSPTGPDYERVSLRGTPRRGIPGQASYLVTSSSEREPSYALRGTLPLRLICESLPPPPPGAIPPLTPVSGSRRERYQALTADPVCASCHVVMNPLAFAFDHFDEQGRYVASDDAGFPIDSTGALTTFNGITLEFADSAELTQKMSELPEYSSCFVRHAASWLVGVDASDPAVLDYVSRESRRADDAEALALIREFVTSDHFRYRKP